MDATTQTLTDRAGARCELCGSEAGLAATPVPPGYPSDADRCVLACDTCRGQLRSGELAPTHWFCLQESAWSEVPAVQVVAWRVLNSLSGEAWAHDLLDQLYIPDEVMAWAQTPAEEVDAAPVTLDSNGSVLSDGDSVTLIKDLDVKGTSFVAKRGTVVKNIRLTGDPGNIEGRVNKIALVLKTEFLKKVS